MNYFTEEEAINVKKVLVNFIGKKMKYSPIEEPSTIINVNTQETPHEIRIYGKIVRGYIVVIQFEHHAGLVPALFYEFNDLELNPIVYATHSALSPGEKRQVITMQNLQGEWKYEDAKNRLMISITKEIFSIDGTVNDKHEKDQFSSNGHWFSLSAFLFTDHPTFIVIYANEKEMEFGKIKTPNLLDGNYDWKFKFYRVK